MIQLPKSLSAWGDSRFEETFRQELAGFGVEQLPLQQGLSGSSYATDTRPQVMLISSTEANGVIHIKAGIFYAGIIAGCSCADDPTPVEEQAEYCVVQVDIDKTTGEATIALTEDE